MLKACGAVRLKIDAGTFFVDNVVKYVVSVSFPLRDRGLISEI